MNLLMLIDNVCVCVFVTERELTGVRGLGEEGDEKGDDDDFGST